MKQIQDSHIHTEHIENTTSCAPLTTSTDPYCHRDHGYDYRWVKNPNSSRQAGNGGLYGALGNYRIPIYNHTHDPNDISRYVKADQGTGQQYKANIYMRVTESVSVWHNCVWPHSTLTVLGVIEERIWCNSKTGPRCWYPDSVEGDRAEDQW